MINPEELRIGNWILLNDVHFGKVVSIEQRQFATENHYNKRRDGTTGDYWLYETNYVQPISLTNEILEACEGEFTFHRYIEWWIIKIGSTKREVKYLHKFQNLYFELTGKELEVKLPQLV